MDADVMDADVMDAEVVAELQIVRERGFLYYLRGAQVWRVPRPGPDGHKGPPALIATATFDEDNAEGVHFLDSNGNIARADLKDAPSSP